MEQVDQRGCGISILRDAEKVPEEATCSKGSLPNGSVCGAERKKMEIEDSAGFVQTRVLQINSDFKTGQIFLA